MDIEIGAIGRFSITGGTYLYIGSAKNGISARLARHIRLATLKTGKIHWHIDYLLARPEIFLTDAVPLPGRNECDISQILASRPDFSVPVANFGTSDCRKKCPAHLYKMSDPSADIFEIL